MKSLSKIIEELSITKYALMKEMGEHPRNYHGTLNSYLNGKATISESDLNRILKAVSNLAGFVITPSNLDADVVRYRLKN